MAQTGVYQIDGNLEVTQNSTFLGDVSVSPNGVDEALNIQDTGISALVPLNVEQGLVVTNGLTTSSITLGGVTYNAWPILSIPTIDSNGNLEVGTDNTYQGAADNIHVIGDYNWLEDSGKLQIWGGNNQVYFTDHSSIEGSDNVLYMSDFSEISGEYTTFSNSSYSKAMGPSNALWDSTYALAFGAGNNLYGESILALGSVNNISNTSYTLVTGYNNVVQDGDYMFSFGDGNVSVYADQSALFGSSNLLLGGLNVFVFGGSNYIETSEYSSISGMYNEVMNGYFSTATGNSNILEGEYISLTGLGNKSYSAYSTVFGRYSTYDENHDRENWIAAEPLFLIGNGTDDLNRSNALELLKNGNMQISGTLKADKGVVLTANAEAQAGAIRWTGTNFEGYDGTAWVLLSPATDPAGVNGDISMGPFN